MSEDPNTGEILWTDGTGAIFQVYTWSSETGGAPWTANGLTPDSGVNQTDPWADSFFMVSTGNDGGAPSGVLSNILESA